MLSLEYWVVTRHSEKNVFIKGEENGLKKVDDDILTFCFNKNSDKEHIPTKLCLCEMILKVWFDLFSQKFLAVILLFKFYKPLSLLMCQIQ